MKTKLLPLVLGLCGVATLAMAIEAGKSAFTKRYETALLEEPQPLAKAVATLPLAEEVKVLEMDGRWAKVARVGGDKATGWIFAGNLADTKPAKDTSVAGLGTTAGATTASVAARPLNDVAKEYASKKGKNSAADDIQWMEKQGDALGKEAVMEYMKAEKKGEFGGKGGGK